MRIFLRGVSAALVVWALIGVTTVNPDRGRDLGKQRGNKTWTVWHTECPVYASANHDSEPIATLRRGDTIDGWRYVRMADMNEWIVYRHEGSPVYAPFAWLTHVPEANQAPGNLKIGSEVVDRWNALPDDYEPSDLVTIPGSYGYAAREFRIRRDSWEALKTMLDDMRDAGMKVWICSAYRSYSWQAEKFKTKIEKEGHGQRVSAKPGHSEHQLGTTVDLAGPDRSTLLEQSFGPTKEGRWVAANCERYGFVLSYTDKNQDETGYIYEPWHIRHVGKK